MTAKKQIIMNGSFPYTIVAQQTCWIITSSTTKNEHR